MSNKKWKILAEDYNVSLFPLFMFLKPFTHDIARICGKAINNFPFKLEKSKVSYLYEVNDWVRVNRLFVKKIFYNPNLIKKIRNSIESSADKLIKLSKFIFESDLTRKSNIQLWDYYKKFCDLNRKVYMWGLTILFLDYSDQTLFSDTLQDYLEKKVKKITDARSVAEYFSVLTTPLEKSFAKKEQADLFIIIGKIQNNRKIVNLFKKPISEIDANLPVVSPAINKMVNNHVEKFCWVPYVYEGPAMDKIYYLEVIKNLLSDKINVKVRIEKHKRKIKELIQKQKFYIKELGIDRNYQKMFKVAHEVTFIKPLRRDLQTKAYYYIEGLLREIGKRLNLTIRQIRFMLPEEVKKGLLTGSVYPKILNERYNLSICLMVGKNPQVLIGKKAHNFLKNVEIRKTQRSVKEINGTCACPGKVNGVVKIINTPKDMIKMKEGDVLVSLSTNPNLVPAIKKSAAIVTDEGGLTCHAAIVSRELNIPCVVGTQIATKVLRDGDLVNVDADHGRIRKL